MSPSDQNKLSKKKQKTFKNLLVQPNKSYWPIISENDSLSITKELKICLTPVKINMPRVPFSVIRNCPKEERKKKQVELLNKQPPDQIEAYYKALELRKSLFLGINTLCKGIEEYSVGCCILEANVSPRILVSHAAELANQNNVPLIVVDNLKDIMKNSIGFTSMALGFQKSIENDKSSIFHNVYTQIIEISKVIRQKLNQSKEEITVDICELNNSSSAHHNHLMQLDEVPTIKAPTNNKNLLKETSSTSLVDNKNVEIVKQDIYLYRKSTNNRVFKPTMVINKSLSPVIATSINNDDGNMLIATEASNSIINIDKDEEDNDEQFLSVELNKTNQRYYQPVTVKRVKNNPTKKKKSKTVIKK